MKEFYFEHGGVVLQVKYKDATPDDPPWIESIHAWEHGKAVGPDLTPILHDAFILTGPAEGTPFISNIVEQIECQKQ